VTQHQIAPDIFPVEVKEDSTGVHITCNLSLRNKLFLDSDFWTKGSHGGHQSFYSSDWLGIHRPFGEYTSAQPGLLVRGLEEERNIP
jgi:hypothetical protein